MRIFKFIILTIFCLIVAVLIIAAFLPSEYVVQRSVIIKQPVAFSFEKIAKFSNWSQWSPWYPLDTNTKYVFTGGDGKVGSKMSWESDKVGSGYITLNKLDDGKKIVFSLVFIKPFAMESIFYFTFLSGHNYSKVTWVDKGKLSYPLGRIMGLFVNMDKMMGPDFDKGFNNIKNIVEKGIDIKVLTVPEQKIYYISQFSTLNPHEIQEKLTSAYGQLMKFINENKIQVKGAPIFITTDFDFEGTHFDAAIPVDDNSTEPTGDIQSGILPGGKIVQGTHIGAYTAINPSYREVRAFIKNNNLEIRDRNYEVYISDPGDTPESLLMTYICFPVK